MVLEVVSLWQREREIRKPLCRKKGADNKYFDDVDREREEVEGKVARTGMHRANDIPCLPNIKPNNVDL